MTLADDTQHHVRAPTWPEDVEPGHEVALDGVDFLTLITDTDVGHGGTRLTYEDECGDEITVTVPVDHQIDRYIPAPEANSAYLCVADLVQIERQVAAAPPPSPRQEELLRRAVGPVLRAQAERRAA